MQFAGKAVEQGRTAEIEGAIGDVVDIGVAARVLAEPGEHLQRSRRSASPLKQTARI
jgi:hypothetical protein